MPLYSETETKQFQRWTHEYCAGEPPDKTKWEDLAHLMHPKHFTLLGWPPHQISDDTVANPDREGPRKSGEGFEERQMVAIDASVWALHRPRLCKYHHRFAPNFLPELYSRLAVKQAFKRWLVENYRPGEEVWELKLKTEPLYRLNPATGEWEELEVPDPNAYPAEGWLDNTDCIYECIDKTLPPKQREAVKKWLGGDEDKAMAGAIRKKGSSPEYVGRF